MDRRSSELPLYAAHRLRWNRRSKHPLADRSLQFRFQFWEKQLTAAADQPWIGYGTSSAADGFDRLYVGTSGRNFEPHSIYLKILLEQGVAGFVIFMAILAMLGLIELRRLRSGGVFNRVALAILVLVGVSGLTGPMLDAYPFNLLFWAIAGLAVRLAEGGPLDPGAAIARRVPLPELLAMARLPGRLSGGGLSSVVELPQTRSIVRYRPDRAPS